MIQNVRYETWILRQKVWASSAGFICLWALQYQIVRLWSVIHSRFISFGIKVTIMFLSCNSIVQMMMAWHPLRMWSIVVSYDSKCNWSIRSKLTFVSNYAGLHKSKKEKELEAWISIQFLKMSFTLFNTLVIEARTSTNESNPHVNVSHTCKWQEKKKFFV